MGMMANSFGGESRQPVPAIAHGDPLLADAQPKNLSQGLAAGVALFSGGPLRLCGGGRRQLRDLRRGLRPRAAHFGGLRRAGVKPGDKLILHFRDFADFVPALWGALLAGAVPLPLARNDASRHQAARAPHLFAHLHDVHAAPRVIGDRLGDGAAITLAELEASDPDDDFFDGGLDEPRLLVLSSGTTATPNLVTLSARALINRWWPAMPDPKRAATFLSWSPFDHVMGIGLVSPNLPTHHQVQLATSAFVQSPALWLTALERYRVTHCTMTNFGMSLVERAAAAGAAKQEKWDLSSVAKVGVGAEAISPEVCRRFVAALQSFGLHADAVILGYGLSECGPVVGGEHPFAIADDRSGPFPLLDRPTRGHSVRIVGTEGQMLAESETGAIEVKGPTMTLGYYGDAAGTRALITADGWIRTGDLGRLTGGRLTVTGREKEIIVIHAKKFACVEIEAIAQSVAGVEAAFAVAVKARGGDAPLAAQAHFALLFVAPSVATDDDLGALLRRLRSRIATHFGIGADILGADRRARGAAHAERQGAEAGAGGAAGGRRVRCRARPGQAAAQPGQRHPIRDGERAADSVDLGRHSRHRGYRSRRRLFRSRRRLARRRRPGARCRAGVRQALPPELPARAHDNRPAGGVRRRRAACGHRCVRGRRRARQLARGRRAGIGAARRGPAYVSSTIPRR